MSVRAKHKAICIDVTARTLTERAMSFEDAQAFVGGWLEEVSVDATHRLLVDEEGLLKQLPLGFTFSGRPYVGNGVVFGISEDDYADVTVSADDLRPLVRFDAAP